MKDPIEQDSDCCAYGDTNISDSATAGGQDLEGGELFTCAGQAGALLGGSVCQVFGCPLPKPIADFDLDPEIKIPVEKYSEFVSFGAGACCDIDSPEYNPEKALDTAFNDCAARMCQEFAAIMFSPDIIFNLPAGSIESMMWYRDILVDPVAFQQCTRDLIQLGFWRPPSYPKSDIGAIHNLAFGDFGCGVPTEIIGQPAEYADLDCEQVFDPSPSEAWPPACAENPSWVLGQTSSGNSGIGVPSSGTVSFLPGGVAPDSPFVGDSIGFRRIPCDGSSCVFILDELSFQLSDLSLGPVTFKAPSATLVRDAYGAQDAETLDFGDGELQLEIVTTLSVFGKEIFGGAELSFFVQNKGGASMIFEEEEATIEVVELIFSLYSGMSAELRIGPTVCEYSY